MRRAMSPGKGAQASPRMHPATAAASDTAPARVYDPWLWQATIGQRPAGPASVVFFTSNTRYFESTGVLVGRDGAYRLIPLQVGEDHGLLSPDGRHYVRPHRGVLVDLTTGAVTVTADQPVPADAVTTAVREAGYQVA